MNLVTNYFRELGRGAAAGWNRFWFSQSDPATLGLIRILAGAMLFYTHLVWTLDLSGFFGQHGWLNPEAIAQLPGHSSLKWSWFYWIDTPAILWAVHIAALVVFALLTIGFWSRAMSILAFLATVSYINRASLAQFGLDDTNAMLALYLMIGPCGAAYSVDRWLKRRKAARRCRWNRASAPTLPFGYCKFTCAWSICFPVSEKFRGKPGGTATPF